MTEAERMRRVEELFHRALELLPAERAAYLEQESGSDEAVWQEVLELLQAESAVGEVIASAAAETPQALWQSDGNAEEAWAGRTAGTYRLLRLLGRGGMGVVYLAEREAGTQPGTSPGAQPVAIKFMRRSLHVAAGSLALQQFLLERDALASLQHANIARLLDAGVAQGFGGVNPEEAVPYVVMEYIEGQRLDVACDATEVTGRTIAERMLALCEAVGFAHRNLILHRDLKPGNILLSSDGAVKLLDFGTLKMLSVTDAGAAEPSAMTQAGMRPVTLRYAAPEHVLGRRVTTASDIYSLGMVLYRLLAGRLPPELEGGSSLRGAGLLGWYERLKTGAVTSPSRLSQRRLPRDLAEDLDAIALKAMRYEPEARYASAEAIAEDLRRALEGQSVMARGESTRYLVNRWYTRNRGLFWAGTAAACVLLAGVLMMGHETGIARAEERTASAGVEQERQLAHTLLFDYFDQLRAMPGSTDAQKRAVTEAVAYLNGLNRTSDGAPNSHARNGPTRELQMDQVQGYTTMGSVLGSPYEDNLGQPDAAVEVLQNGVRLAQQLAAKYPNDTDVLKAQAGVNQALGNVYVGQVRMEQALAADREAASASERLASQPTATAPDIAIAASAHDAMGDLLNGRDGSSTSDPERSKQFYEQALAYDRRELQLDPAFFRARRGVAVEMHKLGLLQEGIDPVASAAAQQKALDWLNGFSAQDRAKPAVSRLYYAIEQHVGQMDVRIGKVREGLALMQDVLARYQAVYAADRINDQALYDVVELESNIGEAYGISGNKGQASAHLQACIDDLALLAKHDPKNMNWTYREALVRYRLASVSDASPDFQKREAVALATFAAKPNFNVSDLPDVVDALNTTSADPQLAWTLAQKAVAGAPSLDSSALTICAKAAASAGARDDARRLATRALQLLRHENIATAQQREEIAANTKLAGS